MKVRKERTKTILAVTTTDC